MKKLVYLLSSLFLLSAGYALCSCNSDDPSDQPSSHQNETHVNSIDTNSSADKLDENAIDSIHFSQIGLVGQWQLVKDGRGDAIQAGRRETLTFTDSMTFIETINGKVNSYGTYAPADDEWFHYDSTYHFYKGDFKRFSYYNESEYYATSYHCIVFSKDSIMLKDTIFDRGIPIIAPEQYYKRIKNE